MSKSNETTPNVPTLRFSKLAGQWEQKTFDEMFLILSNNTLSRAELNYENGKYKNIHYGDVLIKFSAFIDVSSPDVPYINDENSSSKLDNILLQDGDIIIADTAEDFTVGKATEVENIDKIKVVSGLHTIPCRPKIKFSPRYLGYYVNSPAYHNQLIPFIQGVKVSSISKTLIKKTFVSFPSLSEQTKIADFLSCLDKKIETQNKIISKYETLIKGIRHRVFGSICGEKQSSLGGFLEEYSEKNVANDLQSVAVGKYGIRKREEIYSKELSADYSKNKVIRKNTLIIGMGSTQIDIGILTTDDCYCVSPAYTTYRIKGINSFYLQEYLIELNPLLSVRYMITSARQGKAVNKEDLMKHLMTIHSESEQKEICQCFENLYSRLQIEKEMLSALQKQKAFLLQSMFI